MKNSVLPNFIVLFLIVAIFYGCKKEGLDPKRVLEEQLYSGYYKSTRTEFLGYDSMMKPLAKTDTFYYGKLDVAYLRRVDSLIISSAIFKYQFVIDKDGMSGEANSYLSTFSNGGTKFTRTDSSLSIESYSQQGSRITTNAIFNGLKQ
jgi:hypothetical protein